MRIVLVSLALLVVSQAWGRLDQDHRVQEPAYGEVAYLYLQGEYFAALTRAQMALERGEVKHHREDLRVLLGAMYSAYGMPEDAEQVFDSLLGTQVSDVVAQRAWIHLAGLFYRQGKYTQSLQTLNEQIGQPPVELAEIYYSLRAKVLMRLGRYAEAAESLDAFAKENPLNAYLRYNLAISWINGEQAAQGQEWLWQLANLPPGEPETDAIKDKAMLALAIDMLRSGKEQRALALLAAARAEGPFADESMMLYVRALLMENQAVRALPVLERLDQFSIQRRPVQEAQLAIPLLYDQLGNEKAAKKGYEAAIQRYASLDTYLQTVGENIANGEWFAEMLGEPQWSTAMDPVPPFLPKRVSSFPTFYSWFASAEFQQGWNHYHELMRQNNLLRLWQQKMPTLNTMLDAQDHKQTAMRPEARALLETLDGEDYQGRLNGLSQRFERAVADQDPLPFATPAETRLWLAQQEAQGMTEGWGELARPDMSAKLDFYRGLLLWDMQEDIVPRQWQRQRELQTLSELLEENDDLRKRVLYAANRVDRLEHFRKELPELEVMLADLERRGEQLMRRQQYALQASAFEQLTVTRNRLKRFSATAHEGLADLVYRSLRARRPAVPGPVGEAGVGASAVE